MRIILYACTRFCEASDVFRHLLLCRVYKIFYFPIKSLSRYEELRIFNYYCIDDVNGIIFQLNIFIFHFMCMNNYIIL